MRLVLATRNRHKVDEIRAALALDGVELCTLDDFPDAPEVVEDGDTFAANARKKAREIAAATGRPALADDSGLAVSALGGAPGVRSARFAGEGADDAANRAELLRRMAGEADRAAAFVCVLALAFPGGGPEIYCEERCEGALLDAERGEQGFGYDPLFVPAGESRTFAEMTRDEKAGFSHRGRALRLARRPFRGALATLLE